MTTPVRIQQRIRQLEGQGLNHTRIARELGVSRTTVIKYVSRDYSPSPREGAVGSRSLVTGEYARAADEWLTSDLRMPRKQRHTARRVHERLAARARVSRRVLLGAAMGQTLAGGASPRVRRVRGAGVVPRHGAGGLRSGKGRGRGRGTDCALSGGLVPVLEHEVRGRAARGDHGVRVPWSAAGLRTHGHGAQGAGVRTTPRASAIATRTARSRRPACSPCSARITGSRPGSATRMRATRRAASRTRSGSCDGDLMVPEPAAEGWDALSRAWLDECDEIARREHYRQAVPIRDLFETDLDHMLPLPGTPSGRMRLAEREDGPHRHRPDRWQPVSRRSEMAFHAPPGRCQGPGHRAARPGRQPHRDVGTRMGPRAAHRHGTDDAAGDHRAQAPDAGAGARSGAISRTTCAACSTEWMDGRAQTWSTTSGMCPRPAGSRPPPRPCPRSSMPDAGSTAPRSTRPPDGSRRAARTPHPAPI